MKPLTADEWWEILLQLVSSTEWQPASVSPEREALRRMRTETAVDMDELRRKVRENYDLAVRREVVNKGKGAS